MSRKESLFKGAMALALAGLVIKVSNLMVRIPLTLLIDAEGLGIYQMALPAFYALFHLAAGGVPVAVQNLVTEYTTKGRPAVANQVFGLAMNYTAVTGGAAMLVLLLGAPALAALLGEPRAALPLMAVAPAVPLFAADAIYRNYLQGRKLMTPSATASVLEQGVKIGVTLAAAYALLPRGKAYAAGGAALGITAGAVVSLIYMAFIVRQIRAEDGTVRGVVEQRPQLVRRMIALAWPVTAGSVTMPLLSLLDVGIVQRGFLRAGFNQSAATAMYGAYSGIAVQVIWFPFVLTNALANAMVPLLSAAKARGDRDAVRERVLLGLRATGLICLPVVLGISVLARPIATVFGDAQAAIPLVFMAPAAYLGPLSWLMTAQLQALGKTGPPMRNFAIGMVVKITLDALLAPIPGVDVKGVSVASVALFFVTGWLNARALEQELGGSLPWDRLVLGPLLAATAMGGALFALGRSGALPQSGWAALAVGLALSPAVYLAALFVTRAVTWAEVREMTGPVGAKLERWIQTIWT